VEQGRWDDKVCTVSNLSLFEKETRKGCRENEKKDFRSMQYTHA